MEEKYCVYKHTNKINGKVYIGQTKQAPKKRWKHGEGYKKNPLFYRAIQKYGWENFEHEILLENLTVDEANTCEILYITFYQSNEPEFGYNLTSGGLNYTISEYTRCKLKEAIKNRHLDLHGEKNPMWGKHHSAEAKEKMSNAKKDVFGEKNNFYGHHHTEESKDRIRKSKGIPVRCIETDTVYWSATEAEKLTPANRKGIYKCCIGEQESCGNFHWEYVE